MNMNLELEIDSILNNERDWKSILEKGKDSYMKDNDWQYLHPIQINMFAEIVPSIKNVIWDPTDKVKKIWNLFFPPGDDFSYDANIQVRNLFRDAIYELNTLKWRIDIDKGIYHEEGNLEPPEYGGELYPAMNHLKKIKKDMWKFLTNLFLSENPECNILKLNQNFQKKKVKQLVEEWEEFNK